MAPGDAHLGDRLSALLDGELAPEEVARARAHLAGCHECAAELEAADAARSLLRSLPPVEPPAGWLDDIVLWRPGRRDDGAAATERAVVVPLHRRSAVLSAVGSVAASLLVLALGAGGLASPFEPQVGDAVDDHASTVAALAGAGDLANLGFRRSEGPATTTPPRDVEGLPPPYRAPLELDGGYRLVRAFEQPDGVHLLYENDDEALSVFETARRVDWGAFEELDGHRFEDGGVDLWQGDVPGSGGHVVVLEHGGLSAVVVGDEGAEEVLEAARSLPAPRSLSLLQRARQACADALDGLSPVG
jgi:hypothetical protein